MSRSTILTSDSSASWLNSLLSKPALVAQAERMQAATRAKARLTSGKHSAAYRAKYPERCKAHDAASYAIRTGALVPTPCLVNDTSCHGRIEAHHWHGCDQAHRLDVVWLCKRHHELADSEG